MATNMTKGYLYGRKPTRNIFEYEKTNNISFLDENSILLKLAVGFEPPNLPVTY